MSRYVTREDARESLLQHNISELHGEDRERQPVGIEPPHGETAPRKSCNGGNSDEERPGA